MSGFKFRFQKNTTMATLSNFQIKASKLWYQCNNTPCHTLHCLRSNVCMQRGEKTNVPFKRSWMPNARLVLSCYGIGFGTTEYYCRGQKSCICKLQTPLQLKRRWWVPATVIWRCIFGTENYTCIFKFICIFRDISSVLKRPTCNGDPERIYAILKLM